MVFYLIFNPYKIKLYMFLFLHKHSLRHTKNIKGIVKGRLFQGRGEQHHHRKLVPTQWKVKGLPLKEFPLFIYTRIPLARAVHLNDAFASSLCAQDLIVQIEVEINKILTLISHLWWVYKIISRHSFRAEIVSHTLQ